MYETEKPFTRSDRERQHTTQVVDGVNNQRVLIFSRIKNTPSRMEALFLRIEQERFEKREAEIQHGRQTFRLNLNG